MNLRVAEVAAGLGATPAGGSYPLAERHPKLRTFFLCVGAQKAGTTWLADTLARHPAYHLPVEKELHHWTLAQRPATDEDRRSRRAYLRWARRRLALALLRPSPARLRSALWVVRRAREELDTLNDPSVARYLGRLMRGYGGEPVAGEMTPAYALLDRESFRRMASLHPRTRFVFVMRDPVDRLWSSVRHRFKTDIRGDEALAARIREAFSRAVERRGRAFAMSDYPATIEALDAAVGHDHVHYMFHETMRTAEEMDRLGAFLGTGPIPFEAGRRVNAGTRGDLRPDPAAVTEARLALDPAYRYVSRRFGAAVPHTWRLDVAA